MIPKHLLSCWFGRGKKSDLYLACEETKRHMLPDWWRFEVNEDTIDPDLLASPYMQAVIKRGEFVKCTEIGRLWALKRFGGVYCDEDVEIVRPFDAAVLNTPFFIGYEDANMLNGAVMGSIAHGETINRLYYGFPKHMFGEEKATYYGPQYLTANLADVECTKHAPETFYPVHYDGSGSITNKSYTTHKWVGGWKGQGNA